MADTKKYYWLKLKRDFFKRHDIKIIESMENGKDYVLFYLKLLLESVDHDGTLRFSETIPYNDSMLATITDTNIDTVRSAVKIFSELGMMDRFDDGTLYMAQVENMLGSETSDAVRMRELREKKKQLFIAHGESEQCSESFKNRSPELEIELDKEIEKEKENKETPDKPATPEKTKKQKKEFIPPTLEEVTDYIIERNLVVIPFDFINWYTKTDWKDTSGKKITNWKNKLLNWDARELKKNPGAKPYSKPSSGITGIVRKCPVCQGVLKNGQYCKTCDKFFDDDGKELYQ